MKVTRITNNENAPDNKIFYNKPCKSQRQPLEQIQNKNQTNRKKIETQFQQIHKTTNIKKLLESFKRIGRNLKKKNLDDISNCIFNKVCLIFINNIGQDKFVNKVGELNDGYLFSVYHNRLGFKVFYLFNGTQNNYAMLIQLFARITKDNLTIFYSGNDLLSIKDATDEQIGEEKCKIVFISDCKASSFFDNQNINSAEILSFSINKIMHGIFIYYYCKTIFNDPCITPKLLFDKLNSSLARYKETFEFEKTNKLNENQPIYTNCAQNTLSLFDELEDSDNEILFDD